MALAMTSLAQPLATPPSDTPFLIRNEIRHNLAPHYPALRALRHRRDLLQSPLYQQIEPALSPLLSAIECGEHQQPSPPRWSHGTLRVVAWNIQRGRMLTDILTALRNDPDLARADVILLSEVDHGMGRSHNRHVARELGQGLGMHYAFGVSYLVLGDDVMENAEGTENTLALAGSAVLSRWPIGALLNLDLPELRDKFSSKSEKRLGKKRALAAELHLPSGPLWVSTCHLDSNASPMQRSVQLRSLLLEVMRHGQRILVGGDFNTTTYDASSKLALVRDLLHKFVKKGFDATVSGYMTPETSYEQPLFALLDELGFAHAGLNHRGQGSYYYDVESPFAEAKLIEKVGTWPTRWLQKRLRPWKGRVPARLDWFVGKNLHAEAAGTVEVMGSDGIPPSDHLPIFVDVSVP